MVLSRSLLLVLAACATLVAASVRDARAGRASSSSPTLPPALCFAPGTDPALVEDYARAFAIGPSLGARRSSDLAGPAAQYQDGWRWTRTATNGSGLKQGDPTTITWSIVPDGTPIEGTAGEPSAPSNLRAFLNSIYGSETVWLPIFHEVFARWGELTGITYVYQPTDDGVPLFYYEGVLGVRGDVRIGGHRIDGNGNVLAYNFYPNNGDMVLDTADAFFANTSNNSLRLRNTIAHEHGHGLGLRHNCPINETKLMEPYLTLAFDGPQHDDVLGANRAYGDDLEHNDHTGSSSDLGALSNGTVTVRGLSADDDTDVDYFQFRVGPGKKATVKVTPVGMAYPQATQAPSGSCNPWALYNSLTQNDLAVQLLGAGGQSVLGTANAEPAGRAETLANVALPGAGTYFVRVQPGPNDVAQLYDLSLTIADVAPLPDKIFGDEFESPSLAGWSLARTGNGKLFPSTAAAMFGARGLEAVVDVPKRLFLQDDTPNAESRYRVRFWFDPNGFVPGPNKRKVQILQLFSREPKKKRIVSVFVRRTANGYQINAKVRRDGAGMVGTGWRAFSDAPHAIELDWKKSASPEAGDGHLQLWIDGTSVGLLSGLDNAAHFVDFVRFGLPAVRATTSGRVYFDRFESRRASYIGP